MSNKRKLLLWENIYSSFMNYFQVSLFPWSYLLVSKYLCAVLFVNEKKVGAKEFQVKN